MALKRLYCRVCGRDGLDKTGDGYTCAACGAVFRATDIDAESKTLKKSFNEALLEQKEAELARLRRELWECTHAEFVDSYKILALSRDIKKFMPDDFLASFYERLCGDSAGTYINFLRNVDAETEYDSLDIALELAIRLMTVETILPLNNIIARAFERRDPRKFGEWTEKLAEEAEKLENGLYDVTLPRDVFVAYKSEDMDKVEELVDYLENKENLSCFVAARNLRHGRISHYDELLEKAIDNCSAIVFVSSPLSRKSGDARYKELPYVQTKDFERAPVEYNARNDYKGVPKKYKKPRVEYLVGEGYAGIAAEKWMNTFFDGYERVTSPRAVAESLLEQLHPAHVVEKQKEERVTTTTEQAEEDYKKGKEYYDNKDYDNAVIYFRKAAEQGNADAQYYLGCCYYIGIGVNKNSKQAVYWSRKAAKQSHAKAQYELGHCYYIGFGVKENYKQAVYWFRKAAEQGNVWAQNDLGFCYDYGNGVERDCEQAVYWYRKAAEQCDIDAQINLGGCYCCGKGEKKYRKQHMYRFRKAIIVDNNVDIRYGLGYEYCGNGVEQDYEQAVYWYRKAAEQGTRGSQFAQERLNELLNSKK